MKQNTVFKKILFLLCAVLVLCLTACKDDVTNNPDNEGSENSGYSQNGDVTNDEVAAVPNTSSKNDGLSGIELEEDVFDDSTTTTAPSIDKGDDTLSDMSNTPSSSDNHSSDNNQSDQNASDENSSDDTVSEENPSENDGTVKLPVDWFD